MDDDVLVLPLDMLQYSLHKPAVDEVLERFKQVLADKTDLFGKVCHFPPKIHEKIQMHQG